MAYTTDWKIILPPVAGFQLISETSTTQQHPLGTKVTAEDRGANANGIGDFVYAKGVADTAVGDWAVLNPDNWGTARSGANAIGKVGVAMSANVANQWGWYQVSGKAVAKALTAFADDANVYLTSTAGSVDDTAVAGDRVWGAKGASALNGPATGMAEFELDNPFVDDGLGSGT